MSLHLLRTLRIDAGGLTFFSVISKRANWTSRVHVKIANREDGDMRRKDESRVSRGWRFSRALPRFARCSIPEKNQSLLCLVDL